MDRKANRKLVKRLKQIAKQRYNASVYWSTKGSYMTPDEGKRTGIGLHYDLEGPLLPVVLAHEIGHCRDFLENYDGDLDAWYDKEDDRRDTVEKEHRAWLYAVDVLNEVGYTDWDFFLKDCHECLTGYAEGLGEKENTDLAADFLVWEVRNRIEKQREMEMAF